MTYRFLLWRDKHLLLALIALFYAYSSYLRVAVRAGIEGRDFTWAYYGGVNADGSAAVVQGAGLYGHSSFLLVQAAVLLWLMCAGLRKPDRFFIAALAGWTTINVGTGLWIMSAFGADLTVEMQTLGISLPYFWITLLPEIASLLLAVTLLVRGLMRPRILPDARWTRLNSVLVAASVVPLLLAAFLLNLGPQHGTADFHGVGMTYIAILLFFVGMCPWERRS
jgi:hypothetical protein